MVNKVNASSNLVRWKSKLVAFAVKSCFMERSWNLQRYARKSYRLANLVAIFSMVSGTLLFISFQF